MARYAPYSIFLDHDDPPTCVNVSGSHDHLSVTFHWLMDGSRPGMFAAIPGPVTTSFYISDPDVAFEFRMRWSGEKLVERNF